MSLMSPPGPRNTKVNLGNLAPKEFGEFASRGTQFPEELRTRNLVDNIHEVTDSPSAAPPSLGVGKPGSSSSSAESDGGGPAPSPEFLEAWKSCLKPKPPPKPEPRGPAS